MATHSSILAWEIPWTEEPGWLQLMGLQRVGHDWATNTSFTLRSHPFSHTELPKALKSQVILPPSSATSQIPSKIVSTEGDFQSPKRWFLYDPKVACTWLFFFFFLAGVWDLNSWTRDWAHVPSTGSTLNTGSPGKSQSLYLLHSLSSLRWENTSAQISSKPMKLKSTRMKPLHWSTKTPPRLLPFNQSWETFGERFKLRLSLTYGKRPKCPRSFQRGLAYTT